MPPRKPPTYTHRRAVTIPNSGGKRKFVVGHGSTLTRAKADSQRLVNEWLAKHQAGQPETMPTLRVYL